MLGLEQGTLISGIYRVIEPLGSGGMGVVWLAHDEQLERDVAIKLIRPEILSDGLRGRFLSEARAMARVSHPNVLPIYAFGEHEDVPYFVTELVRGRTVDDWLKGRPPATAPDLDLAFKIVDETCRGVAAIHASGTVHRDLKPSNLLLSEDFRVRVADLGVAGLLWSEGLARHELVGTPEYMAPEAVLQLTVPLELAPRADVYALGCLAFELFTGTTPFHAKNPIARMLAHVNRPMPRPSALRPDLPPDLDEVVLAALAKDPEKRTPSADTFRRALLVARGVAVGDPARILLADDDHDFREILGNMLRREFPRCAGRVRSDGDAALEAFERRRHSVAIVNLRMPRIGGTALTVLLRGRPAAERVPIVVLTDRADRRSGRTSPNGARTLSW